MKKKNVFGWLVSGLLAVGLPGPVTGFQDDGNRMWDQFLGPAGNGHSTATNLPTNLDDAANIEWRVDIPGRAWSSPLILEDEIWITTAIETEATGDALAEKMEQADIGGMTAWESVQLQAIRLKRSDGSIQQTVDLFRIDDPPLIHSLNSFASPTPVADDETVYCHFGAFGTAAVDRRTGNVNWRNTENVIDHQTGPGSSPILNGEMLILHCDGCDQQYVCALDTKSGEQLWRTDRSGEMHPEGMYKKAFCTPIVIERGGNLELISPAANWVYGYNPANGEELWRVNYGQLGFSNVARPLVDQETLYVCSCFMQSRLLAIDLSGNQPLDDSRIKWTYQGQVPNMPTPVIVDGMILFTSDRGIITCVDASSGEKLWQDRLGRGYSASPLLAEGRVYFGDHDGMVHIVVPDRDELQVLQTVELDSQIMASPAAVDESLFIRTAQSLYHFRK